MQTNCLLVITFVFPFVMALLTFLFKKEFGRRSFRQGYVVTTLAVNLGLIIICLVTGGSFVMARLTPDLPILLKVDEVTIIFTLICSVMWLLSGIFSFEYMKHEGDNERYYLFFMLTLGALNGLGFAGNYLTLYFCFELMTVFSFPMVLHSKTAESIKASMKYLFYSIGGASLGLVGLFFAFHYCDTIEFLPGGTLNMAMVAGHEPMLLTIFFIVIIGFGAKAGMFPLHNWLPTAHPVAPAPASAVLSGVITKAGVLAIVRVVYYTLGADFIRGTWVQYAWMSLCLATIFMGSMLAYKEDIMKKRLAYSSCSQVSYVLFGLSTLTATGITGSFLQMMGHSIVKDMLFMCAGAIIYKTGYTRISELRGIGKRMPVVMWCWTLGGLSLVGVPPLIGFISKWNIATGALEAEAGVLSWMGPMILLISAFLTAGYLLTVSKKAFLPGSDFDYSTVKSAEPSKLMTVPLIILAAAAMVLGIVSGPFADLFNGLASTIV